MVTQLPATQRVAAVPASASITVNALLFLVVFEAGRSPYSEASTIYEMSAVCHQTSQEFHAAIRPAEDRVSMPALLNHLLDCQHIAFRAWQTSDSDCAQAAHANA